MYVDYLCLCFVRERSLGFSLFLFSFSPCFWVVFVCHHPSVCLCVRCVCSNGNHYLLCTRHWIVQQLFRLSNVNSPSASAPALSVRKRKGSRLVHWLKHLYIQHLYLILIPVPQPVRCFNSIQTKQRTNTRNKQKQHNSFFVRKQNRRPTDGKENVDFFNLTARLRNSRLMFTTLNATV